MSSNSISPSRKWTTGSLVGALAAAFMASICCIGPLVFAILGLGGAGLLVKFERYRPYFIAVTVGLLAVGFYFTYRPAKITEGDACGCEHPKANRLGRALLWIATVGVAGLLAFPTIAARLWSAPAVSQQAVIDTAQIDIDGMDCAACTTAIGIAVQKLDGVKDATVRFAEKRATVRYAPSKVTTQQLVDAINRLGYQAHLARPKS